MLRIGFYEIIEHITECLLIASSKGIVWDVVKQALKKVGWCKVFGDDAVVNKIRSSILKNSYTSFIPIIVLLILFHAVFVMEFRIIDYSPILSERIEHNTLDISLVIYAAKALIFSILEANHNICRQPA